MSGSGINFGEKNKKCSTTVCWLCGRNRPIPKIDIFRLETCGHVFCRTCLYSESSGTKRRCPLVNCAQLYKEPVVVKRLAKPIDEAGPIYLYEPSKAADAFLEFLEMVLPPKPESSGSGTSKPSTSKSQQQNVAARSSSSTISKASASPSFKIPEGYTDACQHCGRIAADIYADIVLIMNCNHVLCRECMSVNKDLNKNLIKRECPFDKCRRRIVKVEVLKKASIILKESIFDVFERKIKSTELNGKKPLVGQAAAPSAALSAAPISSALPIQLQAAAMPMKMPKTNHEVLVNAIPSAALFSVTSPVDHSTPAQHATIFGGKMKSKQKPEIYPVPTPMPWRRNPWDYHLPMFREKPQPIPGTFPPVYAYTPPTNDGLPDSW